jgi:hypothetical protein
MRVQGCLGRQGLTAHGKLLANGPQTPIRLRLPAQ